MDRPDMHLWLVGDGAERAALEAQAAPIADRVRFLGWQDEPMHAVAAADAFVMPSRLEPLGNALLEAWHAGVPTVSTRTEGPDWYATDETDCLLVEADPAAIGGALDRLAADPALGRTLVDNATATLQARFTRDRVVAQYLDLFDRHRPRR
jgi:glycosyltransferase involved in cell wall biosynthesis